MAKKTIVILGDTHFPYCHVQTIYHFYEWIEKYQPDYIIQIGDLKDCYAQSRFAKKITDPEEEVRVAHIWAKEFWYDVKQRCKKAQLIQILGNHDLRIVKKAIEKCPELLPFLNWQDSFKFDGVKTIYDTRAEFLIEGINITHGHRKHGTHMLECMNHTTCGHTHTGGVVFKTFRNNLIWELNVGYAGDPTHEALAYTPKAYVNWTHGFGVIDEYGPRFIPWDKKNRK